MMTKIEWTDEVWNPVTGCTKVSAGCKNCYAERMAKRLAGRVGYPAAPHQFDVTLHPDKLDAPLHWRKPRRVFVNSMSDLFHEDVSNQFRLDVWWRMVCTKQHTYQILTKRPETMYYFVKEWLPGAMTLATMYDCRPELILPNVQLGVSVENQQTADERIPWLLKTPAAVRFVSYEPALGPVDLQFTVDIPDSVSGGRTFAVDALNWIIAGCESGPGARPANPDWFRSVRDQCQEADVPFFLKQMKVDGKLIKMPELDGKVWNEYPR